MPPLSWAVLATLACGDTADTAPPTDSDPITDSATDTGADWVSITLTASAETVSTRERVTLTLEAEDADGNRVDGTAEAVFSSSDTSVLEIYESPYGQPKLAGTVIVEGSFAGLVDTVEVDITLATVEPGDLVFNEVLADGTVDGDPNGDGTTDAVQDEFVELVNFSSVTVDLSGAMIAENDHNIYLPRHTFAAGTVLLAGEVLVVFGGGDADALTAAHAAFVVVDNDDPGSSHGLSLGDAGERVWLVAADGTTELASMAYGTDSGGEVEAVADASMVLDPEVTGSAWVDHRGVADSAGSYSPGTHADGTPFGGPDAAYGGSR